MTAMCITVIVHGGDFLQELDQHLVRIERLGTEARNDAAELVLLEAPGLLDLPGQEAFAGRAERDEPILIALIIIVLVVIFVGWKALIIAGSSSAVERPDSRAVRCGVRWLEVLDEIGALRRRTPSAVQPAT
jgi:hypothetical protein